MRILRGEISDEPEHLSDKDLHPGLSKPNKEATLSNPKPGNVSSAKTKRLEGTPAIG